jgi:hypothetical protein
MCFLSQQIKNLPVVGQKGEQEEDTGQHVCPSNNPGHLKKSQNNSVTAMYSYYKISRSYYGEYRHFHLSGL